MTVADWDLAIAIVAIGLQYVYVIHQLIAVYIYTYLTNLHHVHADCVRRFAMLVMTCDYCFVLCLLCFREQCIVGPLVVIFYCGVHSLWSRKSIHVRLVVAYPCCRQSFRLHRRHRYVRRRCCRYHRP